MSNNFLDYLNQIVPLTEECKSAINDITIKRVLSKNAKLLTSGNICHEFHFIEKGLARVYYYKEGRDVTAWFAAENQIVSAIDSLFTGKPSMYNIEVLEDSILWSLQFQNIEPVFEAYPKVERLGRLIITDNYLRLDERMKSHIFSSAEERYEILLKQIPGILNRTKLGFIATYINVSQEHLSRLRGNYRG